MKLSVETQDYLNHSLGRYIAFSVHDVKHYPRQPWLAKKQESKWLSDDELERKAIEMTKQLGGTVHGINNS